MEIKTSLGYLTDPRVQEAFSEILRPEEKLPIQTAYRILQTHQAIQKELANFETLRGQLLDRYGAKTPDGQLQIEDDNYVLKDPEAFDQGFKDLLKIEVTLPALKMADLEPLKIKIEQLSVLLQTGIIKP